MNNIVSGRWMVDPPWPGEGSDQGKENREREGKATH